MDATSLRAVRRWLIVGTIAAAVALAVVVVLIVVTRPGVPGVFPAHLLTYRAGATSDEVIVTISRGACDTIVDRTVQEDASFVRVSVLLKSLGGACTANIIYDDLPFKLVSPLAGRAVLDAKGAPLPTPTPTPR